MSDMMADAMAQAQSALEAYDKARARFLASWDASIDRLLDDTSSRIVETEAETKERVRVRVVPAIDSEGVVRAIDWIRRNGERFAGQWVALHNGELVFFCSTYSGLVSVIGEGHGLYVAKV